MKREILCAAVLAAAAACQRAPEPFAYSEPSLAVHSVLVAGQAHAAVHVAVFAPGMTEPQAASGARVRLARGATVLELAPAVAGGPGCFTQPGFEVPAEMLAGCYVATVPGGVRAGDSWALEVELPTGERVTGATTVPAAPVLSLPAGTRVPVRNRGEPIFDPEGPLEPLAELTVAWQGVDPTARLRLSLGVGSAYTGGAQAPAARCGYDLRTGADEDLSGVTSSRVEIYAVSCGMQDANNSFRAVAWDSVDVPAALVAYDTAFSRYSRNVYDGDAISRTQASAGVTGGYGAFGGASPATTLLRLVAVP